MDTSQYSSMSTQAIQFLSCFYLLSFCKSWRVIDFLGVKSGFFIFYIFNRQLHMTIKYTSPWSNPLRYETRSLYLKLWMTCRSCSQLNATKKNSFFVGDSTAVTWGVWLETSIRIPTNQGGQWKGTKVFSMLSWGELSWVCLWKVRGTFVKVLWL